MSRGMGLKPVLSICTNSKNAIWQWITAIRLRLIITITMESLLVGGCEQSQIGPSTEARIPYVQSTVGWQTRSGFQDFIRNTATKRQ